MKKKVPIQDLRQGMYVSELDRNWLETPFLFQGFEIKSDEQIDELKKYCQHVFIDTEQGSDITAPKFRPSPQAVTPLEPSPNREVEFEVLKKFSPGHLRPPRYHDQSTLEQELTEARGIVTETRDTVFNIMEDVRLGRSVNTTAAKKVVADMVDSVIRNPDALVCLNQLKNKHEYTALHSLRVCVLALAFGRHLEFSDEELNLLGIGALLHDVGKMKVPNEILDKPGKLTGEEFDLMKGHVPEGVKILEQSKGILPVSIEVARSHHERYDGHGYAFGAKESQIGLFGSIGAIVDCYDAITSDRSYHDGMSAHDALKKMYSWRGTDFHPQLIEQFIQCMGIYPIGSVVELSTGGVGVVVSINRKRRLKPKVALVLNSDKTPFTAPKVIDLMHQPFEGPGKEVEIRRVLSPGLFNINPSDFIPLGA